MTTADILVVEDDQPVRLLLADLLEDEGYSVRQASDGIEALDRCREALPDLMLLDLNMPRLDGVALIEALEELGWRTFPILVVSAVTDRASGVAGRISGMETKPLDLERLVRQVSRLLLERGNGS